MSSLMFAKTTYENFGPFERAEVDFSQPGLTTIAGVMQNFPGADDNGAGKSMLLEGLSFCVYGRLLRDRYSPDECIRSGSKGGMCVKTEIVGGKYPIRIERYLKHTAFKKKVLLFVDNQPVTRGTDTLTDDYIAQILGMDFVGFTNGVAFAARGDIKSFFSATDSERKKVLDRLLGLEQYAEAEKVSRRRLAVMSGEYRELTDSFVRLESRLAEKKEQFSRLDTDTDVQELKLKLNRSKAQRLAFEKVVDSCNNKIKQLKDEIEAETEKSSAKSNAYQVDLAKFQNAHKKLAQACQTTQAGLSEHNANLRIIREAVRRLKAAQDSRIKNCPTCKQAVKAVDLNAEIKEGESRISELSTKVTALEMQYEMELKACDDCDKACPAAPVFSELETLKGELADERNKKQKFEQEVRGVQGIIDQMERNVADKTEQVERLQSEIVKAEETFKSASDRQDALKFKMTQLEFWVGAFGNSGLKSFLVEAEAPSISRIATMYAQRLLRPGAKVWLHPTRPLKTSDAVKEELTVEGLIPGCTKTYAGASKAQKTRLDLCLLLGFRDLVASRQTCAFNQMFADELFDGLDPTGSDCVVELLKELSAKCPIVLITHDPRLKSVGDQRIVVSHDGNIENGKAEILALRKKSGRVTTEVIDIVSKKSAVRKKVLA